MRLEETQLADLLRADAAGCEIRNTAGVKFKADVGDISFSGEDRKADGVNLSYWRVNEAENDVSNDVSSDATSEANSDTANATTRPLQRSQGGSVTPSPG